MVSELCRKKEKKTMRYLRKLHIELPHDSAIPLLAVYPDKTFLEKDTHL